MEMILLMRMTSDFSWREGCRINDTSDGKYIDDDDNDEQACILSCQGFLTQDDDDTL